MKTERKHIEAMKRMKENSAISDCTTGKVRPTIMLVNQLVVPPTAMPTDRGPTGNSSEVNIKIKLMSRIYECHPGIADLRKFIITGRINFFLLHLTCCNHEGDWS